ncbi:MAG: class IIb bacteriocin, lactobin A/cerein 7B family [Dolichospermum sp.]
MTKIQIADLHSENFVELTAEEQYLIQGGIWPWIAGALVTAGAYVITHWSDIKKGVSDAWRGK